MIGMCMIASNLGAKPVEMVVDKQVVETQVAPINEGGTILVPLRVVGEALGAGVEYVPETQMIFVAKGYQQIVIKINEKKAVVNEQIIPLEVAPKLINNVAMVPIRLISENLDCTIAWNQQTQTVSIESKNVADQRPIATIKIKDIGEVKAELYPATAPSTVANFIALANEGFYDGLTFHRVIEDFMIQGGCPEGNGMGGPGYSIPGEFTRNGYVNMLQHTEGVLSMARSVDYNSAGSQFFIMTEEAPHLDHEYAAFGKVISGMEYVYTVEGMETDKMDKPLKKVVIESIRVETKERQ